MRQPKAVSEHLAHKTRAGHLYHADCLDILPHFPDGCIDCIFADPPFNLGKDYGKKVNDSMAHAEYVAWCKRWMDECIRLLADGGSFFLYNLPKWNVILGAYLSERLTFRHWITVDIKFSLPIRGRLYPSNYSMLYYCKGKKPKAFHPPRLAIPTCPHCGKELRDYGGYKNKMNPKGVNVTDVWTDIPPVRHRKYKNRGANELSLKLLDRVVDIASDEDDLVLDPFGGSGTTYIACELKGRKWIGIEKGSCQPIIDRLEDRSTDRTYLANLDRNKNCLFTPKALELRKEFGHQNGKYRISETQPRCCAEPTLFD